jgi:hypothetical protein
MITNTISAIGEITIEDLDTNQDKLTAGNNVTIVIITDENKLTTNTISAIGEITQLELDSY